MLERLRIYEVHGCFVVAVMAPMPLKASEKCRAETLGGAISQLWAGGRYEEPGDRVNDKQFDPVVEAIRLLARRGRQIREEQEQAIYEGRCSEGSPNIAYRGMTAEERGAVVYAKWNDEELPFGDMTQLEWDSWTHECARRPRQSGNFIHNCENHPYLLARVSIIFDKLTGDKKTAIGNLLLSREWQDDEKRQVEELIRTAEQFCSLAKP